jgi:hypothetical protein
MIIYYIVVIPTFGTKGPIIIFLWLLYLHSKFSLISTSTKDIFLAQELFETIILSSKYNLFLTFACQYLEKSLIL